MTEENLKRRLAFLTESERMDTILRQTPVPGTSRMENDAEHSYHFALTALTLAPYAAEKIDLSRVLQMALLHDLVELYAGDTYVYDSAAQESQAQREEEAAQKLYGLLPAKQGAHFAALWREFDAQSSADARFAACIDRLQPLLRNFQSGGISWKQHRVRRPQVEERIRLLQTAAPALHVYAESLLDAAVQNGWLLP